MLDASVMIQVAISAADYSAKLGCIPQYLWYVALCLFVWRNTAKLLHRAGTRVVGGQCQAFVAMELLEQAAQKLRASVEGLRGIERVRDAQAASSRVHEL